MGDVVMEEAAVGEKCQPALFQIGLL